MRGPKERRQALRCEEGVRLTNESLGYWMCAVTSEKVGNFEEENEWVDVR